jgi:transposase
MRGSEVLRGSDAAQFAIWEMRLRGTIHSKGASEIQRGVQAEVVALVRPAGKSIGVMSRDLNRSETAAREWVNRADVDGGKCNGVTTAEREELSLLRRQVRVLEKEHTICKKAATVFAKETR